MANGETIQTLRDVLADDSRGGFFQRRRAAKQLVRLAQGTIDIGSQLDAIEAREVVEGLAVGLESVHWSVHRRCKRALETLQSQPLIEAVCDLIIKREAPWLRDIAVTARYEPRDSLRKAAYLFVLGRQQFYEEHDPTAERLTRFYIMASADICDHLLALAQTRATGCWGQWLATLVQRQGGAVLSEGELTAALEVLPKQQKWTELWEIVQTSTLPWSWQGVSVSKVGGKWVKIGGEN